MNFAVRRQMSPSVPKPYGTVRLIPAQTHSPLDVCVLVNQAPEPGAATFVTLRQNLDSTVLLGCITDAAGRPVEWIEVWVQTVAGLANTPAACREALSNAVLDARWSRFADTLEQSSGRCLLRTGNEAGHPRPLYFDTQAMQSVYPVDAETQAPWRLCTDDALLQQHGLPPYSTSLHRYLVARVEDGEQAAVFSPQTPEAPLNEYTVSTERVAGDGGALVPINPEGGLLLVRPYCALSLEEFLDVLGGGTWEGIQSGRDLVDPTNISHAIGSADSPHTLFLSAHGRAGRLIESLHIKLCILADILGQVHDIVSAQQRPFLNLSNEAFRVRFCGEGIGLPLLWTATTAITDSGDAVVLPIKTSDARYFLSPGNGGISIYRPQSGAAPVRGRATVRIRKILTEERDGAIAEGTLQTQEDLRADVHDLTWLRMSLGRQTVDLYATVAEDAALALGEWRFRTVPQSFAPEVLRQLQSAEGVPVQSVPFEVLPLRSTPCDLYSLAVLAVRVLLVDPDTTLPVALDELISLAREAGAAADAGQVLPERIAALFARDARWVQSLGPQRLIHDPVPPEFATGVVPSAIWYAVLAAVARMLPGLTKDSRCRGYGDAPAGALHRVFREPLEDFLRLTAQTRNLIVTDWTANREARAIIAACLNRYETPTENGRQAEDRNS